VLAAGFYGHLRDWFDPWALAIPAAGVALLVIVGRHFLRRAALRPAAPEPEVDGDDWPEDTPIPPLHRVRLQPTWGCYGLFEAETGEDRQPLLYVPEELADRIHYWQYAFKPAKDGSERLDAEFEDAAHEAEHRQAGQVIRQDLIAIFGEGNVEGPIYPDRISYVGAPTRLD
jgi:hypothetical protein